MALSRFLVPLLFAIPLTSIAAMYADQAQQLRLPTASLAPSAPLFMLAAYWGLPALLCSSRLALFRDEIAAAIAAVFAIWPVALLELFSVSLQLPRTLKHEEEAQLRTIFPHPFVLTLSSGKGNTLRIRRADQCEAVTEFIQSIKSR